MLYLSIFLSDRKLFPEIFHLPLTAPCCHSKCPLTSHYSGDMDPIGTPGCRGIWESKHLLFELHTLSVCMNECFSVVWCSPELLLLSLPPSRSPAFFLLSLCDDIAWWLRVWALAPTAWLAQLVLLLTNLCDNDWLLELSVPPFPTMRTKIMLISCKDQLKQHSESPKNSIKHKVHLQYRLIMTAYGSSKLGVCRMNTQRLVAMSSLSPPPHFASLYLLQSEIALQVKIDGWAGYLRPASA